MGSPGIHARPFTTHNPSRITGPQPVDNEKQVQLQLERAQQLRRMIETEQIYIEKLRCSIASTPDEKQGQNLEKAERNLEMLLNMLKTHQGSTPSMSEQSTKDSLTDSSPPPPLPSTPPPKTLPPKTKHLHKTSSGSGDGGNVAFELEEELPPPLPKRNRSNQDPPPNNTPTMANNKPEENGNNPFTTPVVDGGGRNRCFSMDKNFGAMLDNAIYCTGERQTPPPLPPRNPPSNCSSPLSTPNQHHHSPSYESDGANSINKQMSYPLVATCATIFNNYPATHTHQRTKSSPESLISLTPSESSTKRIVSSESMQDFNYSSTATPPGTPPPPYPSPLADRRNSNSNRNSANTDEGDCSLEEMSIDIMSSPDASPMKGQGRMLANSSPIHAATPHTAQQSIMSMEDDEISEQDASQFDDHGPFKSLAQLWMKDNLPYLAVFMNYVLSHSDPDSLLFYLITDLYKEGNAKEMRKWAYEIHSCFLVPGAPLRINNVDETIAHEIDLVLQNEHYREEILRKIFWKARSKAKDELSHLLNDFQQKRIAGLGTIYGPADSVLLEMCNDKGSGRDIKHYETLLERLDPYLEELDKPHEESRKYYTAAALITVFTRIFAVRPPSNVMEKCPIFVNREKSLRSKLMAKYRKIYVQGHQYVAQHYYTVIRCYNCHQIIYGIAPQGYQCLFCHINLHRPCIQLYEDACPGPMKQKGMMKLMDRIRPENRDQKRKQSAHFLHTEREKRFLEERDNGADLNETGEAKPGNPLTRTPSDRRPDAVREESCRTQPLNQSTDNDNDSANPESSTSQPASTGNKRRQIGNINRSESVKEQPEKNRKQRRNVSDPLRTTGSEAVDLDNSISFHQHSGSSSNSSLSSRSLDSPSSSLDVGGLSDGQGGERDSDMEVEADPPDWKSALTNEQLSNLQANEMKRQDVINELFHTERSHVRNLKVLELIFRREIFRSKILTDSEMKLVFPNLPELLGTHSQFNSLMKTKRKEQSVVTDVGDILLNMFDGERGTAFRNAAAKFCEQQQNALELIKEKRKKDAKFENLLMNCEKNHHCRRLPLQGFLPQEMQRLSKYPLLLGRLIEQEEAACIANPGRSNAELEKLRKALEKSREILKEVNDAAKKASETARLSYINCHLETSGFDRTDNEYKHIDLTKYTFVYEGTVTLKRPNKNPLQVHMLLTEEAVILLQKEGQSYLLKFFHCGNQSNQTLSPIIKMQNVICRPNAADTVTLYLVSNNTLISHMYEIQCRDVNDRKTWLKYFTDASEQYKMRTERTQESEEEPELPASSSDRPETMEEEEVESSTPSPEPTSVEENKQQMRVEDTAIPAVHSAGGEGVSVKLIPNEWPLIQPSEVQVANPPVHTAEPVLTPLEQIKRKDTEVKQALAAKEGLVADLLSIPRDEYRMIADIVSEEVGKKEPSQRDLPELVLAAVFQVDQLLEVVNDSLNVSEADSVAAAGGKHPVCASNDVQMAATALAASSKSLVPSVPSSRLQSIATTLNSQLTILLSAVKGVEEDRENLRKELHRTREQLHEKCSLHGPVIDDDSTQLDSTQSGDLESIEESPTETETT
ncbi:PREDICTED: rho guanine nucleotide exchange factor 11 isoform X2 [Nicrophorus vespilloides]|nr:PREDICTED: rho guanine nucleotide exchange factor 11 isoform X2 [Nicrophorus vespilloides]